ncbi:MAG TPA: SDR family NAD(P)-dependent oxidoreductase [Acidimicrobiales bacterium]|jgi:short-subunit dehydrogenase
MGGALGGQTALVTGASGGLGQAIARRLAAEGASLVVTGRRQEALDALAADIGGTAVAADLADPSGVDHLVRTVGAPDILVANAGVSADGALDSYSHDELRTAIDVNLATPMELTRAFLPAMRDRGSGHLVFISSVSGYVPTPLASVYAATKFGLRGFAHALREELHDSAIGVSLVSPGFISDAGMWAATGLDLPTGLGTKTPEDVAAAVVTAIRRDRRDVVVASALQRLAIPLYALAPGLVAAIMRRGGGHAVAAQVAAAHGRPVRTSTKGGSA